MNEKKVRNALIIKKEYLVLEVVEEWMDDTVASAP